MRVKRGFGRWVISEERHGESSSRPSFGLSIWYLCRTIVFWQEIWEAATGDGGVKETWMHRNLEYQCYQSGLGKFIQYHRMAGKGQSINELRTKLITRITIVGRMSRAGHGPTRPLLSCANISRGLVKADEMRKWARSSVSNSLGPNLPNSGMLSSRFPGLLNIIRLDALKLALPSVYFVHLCIILRFTVDIQYEISCTFGQEKRGKHSGQRLCVQRMDHHVSPTGFRHLLTVDDKCGNLMEPLISGK